jgi:hypothetical protein
VAHSYESSCTGNRDKENPGSKPTGSNSLRHHILKASITKKWLVECLKVETLNSKPSTEKKKKERKKKRKILIARIKI